MTGQIVKLAARAGRVMLENGGETYRVEETANRICTSYGLQNSRTYATPTALIVTADDADGAPHSVMERIPSRRVNLDRVDAINRLSRSLAQTTPDLSDALGLLEDICHRPTRAGWTVVLFSALACAAFSLLFGGGPRDLLPSFAAGCFVRLSMLGLSRLGLNDFFVNVVGGAVATLTGWCAVAVGLGQHMDAIVVSGLMLLVPGLAITNAVRDIAAGDLLSGISRIMEAFFVAVAIACGTALIYLLIPFPGGGVI